MSKMIKRQVECCNDCDYYDGIRNGHQHVCEANWHIYGRDTIILSGLIVDELEIDPQCPLPEWVEDEPQEDTNLYKEALKSLHEEFNKFASEEEKLKGNYRRQIFEQQDEIERLRHELKVITSLHKMIKEKIK